MLLLIVFFYIVPAVLSAILLYILHGVGTRVMSKYDIFVCFIPILNMIGCIELIELYINNN